ncbi:MAG: hypothetical protein EA398_00170, partial [Deltaproteobacteria bacterium]
MGWLPQKRRGSVLQGSAMQASSRAARCPANQAPGGTSSKSGMGSSSGVMSRERARRAAACARETWKSAQKKSGGEEHSHMRQAEA